MKKKPKSAGGEKTPALNFGISPQLRAQLAAAVQESGRSLTKEVTSRLEQSFSPVSNMNLQPEERALFVPLARVMRHLDARTGDTWRTNAQVAKILADAAVQIIAEMSRDAPDKPIDLHPPGDTTKENYGKWLATAVVGLGDTL